MSIDSFTGTGGCGGDGESEMKAVKESSSAEVAGREREEAIKRLEVGVDKLRSKLMPVMRPDSVSNKPQNDSGPNSSDVCDLVKNIHTSSERIRVVADLVETLIERLQI